MGFSIFQSYAIKALAKTKEKKFFLIKNDSDEEIALR